MVNFFTNFCSKSTIVRDSSSFITDNKGCMAVINGHIVQVEQSRHYSKKKRGGESSPVSSYKKEDMEPIQMPGHIVPEKLNEQEYFAKVEKRRIEDLKKIAKPGQPVVKKDED